MFGSMVQLLFKVFFVSKYIKIIYFFIFKKLILKSAHQNDLKYKRNINF